MGEQSIKVNIANRSYPLTVKAEEEEGIRMAVKLIQQNIENLEKNYAVRDKQDLLAMTALEYATKVAEGKVGTSEDESVVEGLEQLNEKLDSYLKTV